MVKNILHQENSKCLNGLSEINNSLSLRTLLELLRHFKTGKQVSVNCYRILLRVTTTM